MKLHYNSPVVLTFSIVSTIVYFLNSGLNGALDPLFILSPYFNFSSLSDYLSVFLYIFGHGSMEHLMGNMMLLLLIGPVLEEKYGSQGIIFMIAVTAFITALLNILFFDTGLLGASGIVFMFIILISFTNVKKGRIPVTFILILILYVGKEIIHSFEPDQISQFAHILGGICGSIFGFLSYNRNSNKNVA